VANVVWSPAAELRLAAALEYVARDSPEAAQNLLRTIRRALQRLAEWPFANPWVGARYPHLAELDQSYRVLVTRPYVLFYRVTAREIRILTLRHGAQLPPVADSLERH